MKLTEKMHTYDFSAVASSKNQLVAKAAEIGISSIIEQFQKEINFNIMDQDEVNQVIEKFQEELNEVKGEITLPDVRVYEEEIIQILQEKESKSAMPPEVYKKLAENLNLTPIQLGVAYQNTKRTIHENRTQFAIMNLRNRGIVLSTSESGRGIWKLSK